MEPLTLYGIPNCDVTRKAISWLNKNKLPFEFYDYKKAGISEKKLTQWCREISWEILLNKRGTTWKGISAGEQQKISSQQAAIRLMQQHTSLIKRPMVEFGKKLLLGFNEGEYKKAFLP